MNKEERKTLENLETSVNVGLKLTKISSVTALGLGAGAIATSAWIDSKHGTLPKSTYVKARNLVEAEKSSYKVAVISSLILGGLTIAASYIEDKIINKNKKEENE